MLVIAVRTLIIYLLLTFMMRLMGKRQIGEMQVPELVVTLMISEAAVLPITDRDIPLLHGVTAIIILACSEIIFAFLSQRIPAFRKILSGKSLILIADGVIHENNLKKARINLEEIFAEIRNGGYKSMDDIQYVILEQTGKMSIITTASADSLNAGDMKIEKKEKGFIQPVVVDGKIDKYFLKSSGKTVEDIKRILKKKNKKLEDVLYMTIDYDGTPAIVYRKE